jgi:hypothetical protein
MPIPNRVAGVKWQVWAIGGVASAGVAWWAYRRTSSKNAATNLDTSTAADPTIDPTTGLPYSSEMYSGATTTPGYGGIYDPSTGATIGTTGQFTAPQVVTSFSNAAEWGQAALQRLIALGYDPLSTSIAIGVYISGANLTETQYGVIQAAIGQTGPAPGVPAPHMAPPAGQTGTGTTTSVTKKWGPGPHIVPGKFNSKQPVAYVNSLVQFGHKLQQAPGQTYYLGGHVVYVI